MKEYISLKYIEFKKKIKQLQIKKNKYMTNKKVRFLKRYNSIYSKDKKIKIEQKKLIKSTIITLLLNGLFLNYVFYSFGLSEFSVGRVLAFGLIYYYITGEFISWYRKLKYGDDL